MNIRNGAIVLLALLCAACSSHDKREPSLKEGAREIGHGVGTAAREVGHGAKKAAKTVGHAARDGTKAVGEAAKEGGKAFKDAVKGND